MWPENIFCGLAARPSPPALARPLPRRMEPTLPDPSAQHIKAMPPPHDIGVTVRGSPSGRMAVTRYGMAAQPKTGNATAAGTATAKG